MTDRFERKMEARFERRQFRRSGKGNLIAGAFIIFAGLVWLASTSDMFYIPGWIISWPTLLIAFGLFSGLRHGFRGPGWLILTALGTYFLLDRVLPDQNFRSYFWPIVVIAAGLFMVFRPRRHRWDVVFDRTEVEEDVPAAEAGDYQPSSNDVVDITAVFGGVKKKMLSKQFKGGDTVAVFGGAELDLTQADIQGRVMIDCFNMFGGTKLIVPADWDVQSDIVAIFGGVDDKRPPVQQADRSKVLFLDGTCLFGGVEIRSY